MRTTKNLSNRIVRGLSRKKDEPRAERATAAKPIRRAQRARYFTIIVACVAVLVLYGRLLGRDPISPQNPPNVPPFITDFVAVEGPVSWVFQGRVLDENSAGLVITFSGLLDGYQTTVRDAEGHFWLSVQLHSAGIATAHTIDDHNQGSNYASYAIE